MPHLLAVCLVVTDISWRCIRLALFAALDTRQELGCLLKSLEGRLSLVCKVLERDSSH